MLAVHEPFIPAPLCSHEMKSEKYSEVLRSPPPTGLETVREGSPPSSLSLVSCCALLS